MFFLGAIWTFTFRGELAVSFRELNVGVYLFSYMIGDQLQRTTILLKKGMLVRMTMH